MKITLFTNEAFERYIDYIGSRRKFEDRWDTLDLDDVTTDIDVPSEGEIDAAVRELDLFDDVAAKSGAKDVDVGGDGRLRLLDFDAPNKNKKDKNAKDARTAGLDWDDSEDIKDDNPDDIEASKRELDWDDKGADVKQKKSNLGAIGALDYDDDVDTSTMAASIDDVYTALASSDPKIVKSMVKRYASDITDTAKIREVLLAHAVQLNYDSLRVMCGDMKITLTAKEKNLGFIDKADVQEALNRFRSIASTLNGENNTYGLIPNAIVSCVPDNQTVCVNIIDFLKTWCNLPIIPLYLRGAITKRCYDLADFLSSEMPDVTLDAEFFTGPKGLFNRLKDSENIPKKIFDILASKINPKMPSRVLSNFIIMSLNAGNTKAVKTVFNNFSENKRDMVIGYVEDGSDDAYAKLAKLLKL